MFALIKYLCSKIKCKYTYTLLMYCIASTISNIYIRKTLTSRKKLNFLIGLSKINVQKDGEKFKKVPVQVRSWILVYGIWRL